MTQEENLTIPLFNGVNVLTTTPEQILLHHIPDKQSVRVDATDTSEIVVRSDNGT